MGHESQNLFLNGQEGRLEAIFWKPEGDVRPPIAAVVCHPHPLFGGTMHNKVAYQAAKSLDALGLAVQFDRRQQSFDIAIRVRVIRSSDRDFICVRRHDSIVP